MTNRTSFARFNPRYGEESGTSDIEVTGEALGFAHEIERSLGIYFTNKAILIQAFVHCSYLNEHKDFPLGHNERLELLGDAVLHLVLVEHVFRTYPLPEGVLTQLINLARSHKTLSDVGSKLGLQNWILRSRGENQQGSSTPRELEDVVEALLGALYLDQGLAGVREFFQKYVVPKIPEILWNSDTADPKTRLQSLTQASIGQLPRYISLGSEKLEGRNSYIVGVFIAGKKMGQGRGSSLKIAEEIATLEALQKCLSSSART